MSSNRPAERRGGLESWPLRRRLIAEQIILLAMVCVAIVAVDPATGHVQVERLAFVHDCGRRINPLLVEGQMHGALAQGLSAALWEEALYDESGQLLTGSLLDYPIPRAADVPLFDIGDAQTLSPVNPMGTRGTAEAGAIGYSRRPPAVRDSAAAAVHRRGAMRRHLLSDDEPRDDVGAAGHEDVRPERERLQLRHPVAHRGDVRAELFYRFADRARRGAEDRCGRLVA